MAPASTLFDQHVFLDLETTGLNPLRDEVIELGAVFVRNGRIERRISELFRPTAPLPLGIQRLTGLTDDALANRPPFFRYVAQLRQALPGWTLVAHNARFERAFLSPLLEELGLAVLDSCELLHYLFPELESHALDSVVRWAGVGARAAHRALQDCEDTFAVLQVAFERAIQGGRGDLVRGLLEVLDPGSSEAGPVVTLLRGLHALCRAHPPPFRLEGTSEFLPGRPDWRRRQPRAAQGSPDERVSVSEPVRALLGSGGVLERSARGFSPREGQLALAQRVADTLQSTGVLATEAGTGTGKSLAYLAPGVLHAVHNGVRVGVAPHTRALQEQLVANELPRLHEATGGVFAFSLLKGQENYLCRRRTEALTAPRPELSAPERAARAYLRAFAWMSPDGDLERVSHWFREQFPPLSALLHAARSEPDATLGEKCPHYRRCFYHSAVAQAKGADLVVLNHALAVRWPSRYPKLDALILDEAHELEDSLTGAFTEELSSAELVRLERRLFGTMNGGASGRGGLAELIAPADSLAAALPGDVPGRPPPAGVRADGAGGPAVREDALRQQGRRLQAAREALTSAFRKLLPPSTRPQAQTQTAAETFELALPTPFVVPADRPELSRLRVELLALAEALGELRQLLLSASSRIRAHSALARELEAAERRLGELHRFTEGLLTREAPSRLLTARFQPGSGVWTLLHQPLEVASLCQRTLVAPHRALILASATLSLGPKDRWVLDRLGFSEAGTQPVPLARFPSPFRLREQARVLLLSDAPDAQSARFSDWVAERIAELATSMGGRVLGLFTSTQRLVEVEALLQARLAPVGLEVLRQHRGSSRVLAARQERDAGSVLLGTKAFWQGLDIRGLGVSCIFIDKLPLDPPERTLTAARELRYAQGGSNYLGFLRYRLPRALLLLRQGVGRLVRSTEDRGIVVLADPGSERYRALVRAALGEYAVEVLPWREASARLEQSILEMGLARKTRLSAPARAGVSRASAFP